MNQQWIGNVRLNDATQNTEDDGEEETVEKIDSAAVYKDLIRNFVSGQQELLQTARYVVTQKAELDDRESRAAENIRRQYPDLDPDLIPAIWECVAPMWEPVLSEPEDADKKGLTEARHQTIVQITEALDKLLPAGHTMGCFLAVLRAKTSSQRSPRLMSSLLISLVAEFEVLVSNVFTELFTKNHKAASASERKYTWQEIADYESLESFKGKVIGDAVSSILYGTYESWLETLKKKFGIDAPSISSENEVLEVFQRRHITVHNGGVVNQQYLDKLPQADRAGLGKRLDVGEEYLTQAADVLMVTGLFIVNEAAKKGIKDSQDKKKMEAFVGSQIYELLQHRRFEAVEKFIMTQDLDKYVDRSSALISQVNLWLSIKRTGQFSRCEAEVRDWDTDILEGKYKLAKLALLDENELAMTLVRNLRNTSQLPIEHWATWPLLEELRRFELSQSDEIVCDALDDPIDEETNSMLVLENIDSPKEQDDVRL